MNRPVPLWVLVAAVSVVALVTATIGSAITAAVMDSRPNPTAEEPASEPTEDSTPNSTEATGLDLGQYIYDHLDGVNMEYPDEYTSTDTCDRAVELGEHLMVCELPNESEAQSFANRDGWVEIEDHAYVAGRFAVVWHGCGLARDVQDERHERCRSYIDNGTHVRSHQIAREFIGL